MLRIDGLACSNHPHNYYLELLSEVGIIGFLLMLAFFAILIKKSFNYFRKNNFANSEKYLLISLFLVFFLEIWPLRSSGSFFTTWGSTLFWLIVSLLWANLEKRQHQTADQLIAAGASPTAARREVDRAIAIWQELEATTYEAQLRAEVDGDELKINIMTRLALNFLGLHRAKLHAYQWIREKCVGNLPLKSFRDLLLISAAVYFEADPPRNIWRVDEFVTLRIEPLCEQLARGLDS